MLLSFHCGISIPTIHISAAQPPRQKRTTGLLERAYENRGRGGLLGEYRPEEEKEEADDDDDDDDDDDGKVKFSSSMH